jgi:cell wall-associated NlpC family hydrolase
VSGLSLTLIFGLLPVSHAAPNLKDVQAKVEALQEEAAMAAENAQAAKIQLAALTRTLASVQQKAAVQKGNVDSLSKSLSAIAVTQFKSGGLSQSLELLFSSNPQLYLSTAGSLEAITRKKAIELRKFAAAQQRLTATTFTVNDKLALVAKAKAKYEAEMKSAQKKLDDAQALLDTLQAAERERLLKLQQQQEDADQASSLAQVSLANGVSGRAGIALRFALKQIGDKYVFGAAGPVLWDCSGLTMRAYQAAGVSLPHSSRAQARMGKSITKGALMPGDLMFFGSPVSHVGIYMGGGKMVHAPRPGSRVKVVQFDSSYNLGRKRFVGARRF